MEGPFCHWPKKGIMWASGLCSVIVVLLWVPIEFLDVYPYHDAVKIRFMATFMIVTAITYWLEYLRYRYRKALRQEHRQLELEKYRLDIEIVERKKVEKEKEALIGQLQVSLEKVNTLRGLIPICANCHSIRDDRGYYNQLEGYLEMHSGAEFTHGISPDCKKKIYPELYPDA